MFLNIISKQIWQLFGHFLAPKEAYRPPCARGQNITFKLHDDLEVPSKSTECKYISAYKKYFIINFIKFIANPSKAALKMKKNREAKKAKKELESNNPTVNEHVTNTSIKIELTDDPEKNKKIKKITSVSILLKYLIVMFFFILD